MRDRANAAALLIVAAVWGLFLAYPMNQLQNFRWTFLGYVVPIYFFFIVGLMMGALALAVAFKREWSRWELLWWALPLICLPGILRSGDSLWSARQWLSWLLRGVIPGGVIFLAAARRRPVALLLYWIYPIVVAASMLGLREVVTNRNPIWDQVGYVNGDSIAKTRQPDNPFYRPPGTSDLSLAPRGTQGNKIPFAATLVGFLPFSVWLLRYRRRFFLGRLIAAGSVFSMLALSSVRGAWLAMLAATALMTLMGLLGKRREAVKFISAAAICLTVFYALPWLHGPLAGRATTFHLADNNIRYRLDVLETSRVLKDRWFAGVGFSQFPTVCKAYYRGTLPWLGTADDQYLRWVIENGIPALVLLFGFFFGLIRSGWRKIARFESVERADFYKSLLVGWVSVAIMFLFFDGFYWGACNMTFWSLLGLFATCLSGEAA